MLRQDKANICHEAKPKFHSQGILISFDNLQPHCASLFFWTNNTTFKTKKVNLQKFTCAAVANQELQSQEEFYFQHWLKPIEEKVTTTLTEFVYQFVQICRIKDRVNL